MKPIDLFRLLIHWCLLAETLARRARLDDRHPLSRPRREREELRGSLARFREITETLVPACGELRCRGIDPTPFAQLRRQLDAHFAPLSLWPTDPRNLPHSEWTSGLLRALELGPKPSRRDLAKTLGQAREAHGRALQAALEDYRQAHGRGPP